jgi:hypothetical protein
MENYGKLVVEQENYGKLVVGLGFVNGFDSISSLSFRCY